MFVSPVDKSLFPVKKCWANYTIYEDGVFYSAFGTGIKGAENPSGYAIALDVAKSADGVHWEFISQNTLPIQGAHAGFGIIRIGEWFYYYPTCSNSEKGVHFKVYRTHDFISWEHMGDEFDVAPDRNYYHERWDEVHVIKDRDENGKDVYYGYISSETRDDVGMPGCGFVKSYDGIRWEVLRPVVIEWGEIPAHHMELNFVENIDGVYFLSMSGRMYMDSCGYSLFTFRGSSPRGPFVPDAEKFRLSGTSRREVTWLGHSIKTDCGFLAALWLSHDFMPDIPSYTFAIGDLKRLVSDNGHLRLAYWEGSEKAKGERLSFNLRGTGLAHPLPGAESERDRLDANIASLELSASRDGVIAMLPVRLDFGRGVVVEGRLRTLESRTHIATHHHSAGAGFYFERTPGSGVAMIAETLGVTRTGEMRYSDKKITDRNPYKYAGRGLSDGRSGILKGTLDFDYEDTVGPLGHASYCGIRHAKEHGFRILARGGYFELYIDDMYVQTYLLPENPSGRFGFCAFDGNTVFSDINIWEMNF